MDLDLLEYLYGPFKNPFEVQEWENIFSITLKISYKPLIQLFYGNMYSIRVDAFVTPVLGKCIFIDCGMFDSIVDIHCTSFLATYKNH